MEGASVAVVEAEHLLESVVTVLEFAGFGVITFGMFGATLVILYRRVTGGIGWEETYFSVRRGNGRSLVLGLELLVAAEIIRSISAETLQAVMLLAAVVVIRTFLAITVEMETEGHWPWNRYDRREQEDSS